MKKNLSIVILYVFMFALIILWYFQGRPSNKYLEYLTLFFASISALFAIRQFRLSVTFNKLNALTINPESSKYVVRINNYLNSVKIKNPIKTVCKTEIENDNELNISIHFILGYFDDIAVGIKNGTISEKLTKEITGTYIIKITNGLKPYIDDLDEYYNDEHYTNLIWLSKKWGKR